MKSYLSSRNINKKNNPTKNKKNNPTKNKKENPTKNKKDNPTILSFTLEWSLEDIKEMSIFDTTTDHLESMIRKNEEAFMKLTADIADKYLTAVVASSGSRVHADILYSIYRDLTR